GVEAPLTLEVTEDADRDEGVERAGPEGELLAVHDRERRAALERPRELPGEADLDLAVRDADDAAAAGAREPHRGAAEPAAHVEDPHPLGEARAVRDDRHELLLRLAPRL